MEAAAVEHWTKKSLPSSGMATSDPERAVERILHFLSNTPPDRQKFLWNEVIPLAEAPSMEMALSRIAKSFGPEALCKLFCQWAFEGFLAHDHWTMTGSLRSLYAFALKDLPVGKALYLIVPLLQNEMLPYRLNDDSHRYVKQLIRFSEMAHFVTLPASDPAPAELPSTPSVSSPPVPCSSSSSSSSPSFSLPPLSHCRSTSPSPSRSPNLRRRDAREVAASWNFRKEHKDEEKSRNKRSRSPDLPSRPRSRSPKYARNNSDSKEPTSSRIPVPGKNGVVSGCLPREGKPCFEHLLPGGCRFTGCKKAHLHPTRERSELAFQHCRFFWGKGCREGNKCPAMHAEALPPLLDGRVGKNWRPDPISREGPHEGQHGWRSPPATVEEQLCWPHLRGHCEYAAKGMKCKKIHAERTPKRVELANRHCQYWWGSPSRGCKKGRRCPDIHADRFPVDLWPDDDVSRPS